MLSNNNINLKLKFCQLWVYKILTMRLQLVTCPDLTMGTDIDLWEMDTLKALVVLIKCKNQNKNKLHLNTFESRIVF